MYGLINKAVQDLVVSTAGAATWKKIKANVGIDAEIVEAANYDDIVTLRLVDEVAKETGQSIEEVLFDFGRYWVLYTGREGWNSVFQLAGDDLQSFLMGLDDMHARVQVAMPEARMPQFEVRKDGDTLQLDYRSERDGLAPMVAGLIDGLGEQFGERWSVLQTGYKKDQGYDSFTLTMIDTISSDDTSQAA